ncbi:WD40 repeat-like protein [Heliocybe sulcata]|uniref:WD40 repeat-like protein n=1 Tax=Heliocybe sulcata TaxID=5364 RepID=A0A5C3N2Z5_9AGAM|nr:WD40 repeat-like protein [Heliocybe sulcata]
MAEEGTLSYGYPEYQFSRSPELVHRSGLSKNDDLGRNFPRTAKWCPDGSVALVQCENRSFQFIEFPSNIVTPGQSEQREIDATAEAPTTHSPSSGRTIEQAAPILDYAWYPSASRFTPVSYCFVASVRECPVKLLDAVDGRLRASYKIVDHRERHIAPHCLAFNLFGNKLYCGFEDAIEVFDVACPGEGSRIYTTPSKQTKSGLKGIISALAFCPSYDSASYFAAGTLNPSSSYSSNIAIFTEDTDGTPVGFVSTDRSGTGMRAAVTQLQFNPTRPHILYASFRRHDCIYSWDLRGDMSCPVDVYGYGDTTGASRPTRDMTNQKLRFDVDPSGQWLSTGDHHGKVSIFDVKEKDTISDTFTTTEDAPILKFHAHDDAVGSVGFHPSQPLLLSVSGSRHFHHDHESLASHKPRHYDSDSSSGSDEDSDDDSSERRKRSVPRPFPIDASIRLWDFK